MKRHEAKAFGTLFSELIDSLGARDAYDQQRICYLWPEVMGPTINRFTARRWVDADTLHVVITSAALKSELGMMRTRIVALLNEAAGKNVISQLQIH